MSLRGRLRPLPSRSRGRIGSAPLGRNTIRGPRLSNYDFSVFRTFPFTERFRLEYRAEPAIQSVHTAALSIPNGFL